MVDVREELNRLAERVMDLTTTPASMPEQDRISASLRALSARAAVPEGWQLVRLTNGHIKLTKDGIGDYAKIEVHGRHMLHGFFSDLLAAAPQPAGKDVAKSDNVIDKLLATVPMPCLPTAIKQSADCILAAVSNPSAYGGKQGVHSTIRSEVKMLHIAADRVRDAITPAPDPSAPAEGCGACGDACNGGTCRLAKESPQPAPAGVEALAMRMYGKWTDNQDIHCNRFPPWSELRGADRDEWRKKAQQAGALEALDETDKDIAVAQAVEFAQYVVDHAKGRMVEAAERFLSMPYSREVAGRLVQAQQAAKGGAA